MTRGPDPRITWIVDYLQRHLGEPVSMPDLAAQVNLSQSRLRALFLRQTGMSPGRYLQAIRLRRAHLLLERTFLSVKEVMALVGYNDPSHFARDFRRHYGAAPSDVRGAGEAPLNPSANPPRHKRIGPPRARDPGRRVA